MLWLPFKARHPANLFEDLIAGQKLTRRGRHSDQLQERTYSDSLRKPRRRARPSPATPMMILLGMGEQDTAIAELVRKLA